MWIQCCGHAGQEEKAAPVEGRGVWAADGNGGVPLTMLGTASGKPSLVCVELCRRLINICFPPPTSRCRAQQGRNGARTV